MANIAAATVTSPEVPELVIRTIGSAITTFSVPFDRFGRFPIGGRTTAIKLQNNNIWILASTPLTPLTLSTLTSLGGPITHLVAPDREHDMYLSQYSHAFPQAKLYVPKSVADTWDKPGSLGGLKTKVGFVFGKTPIGAGGSEVDEMEKSTQGEIRSCDFGRNHANEDVAFLHVPSKTLIQADLLFNLPPTEQYSKSDKKATVPFLSSVFRPGTLTHKIFAYYLTNKGKVGMTASARAVSAWDFDRIIPCHGDVIETGGKQAWNSTYAWFLK